MALQLVEAYSTFIDYYRKHVTLLWIHKALHFASSEQSLIAEDQLKKKGQGPQSCKAVQGEIMHYCEEY